jgi:HEAT repeat protein
MSRRAVVPDRTRGWGLWLPRATVLPLALFCALFSRSVAAGIDVRVEGERISADLSQVPIAEVLTAIAEQTGAKLSIRGNLGTVRPQAFSGVPLVDALPQLAQPNGVLLRFAPAEGGDGRRLVAIVAVAPGAAGPAGDGSGSQVRATPAAGRLDPRKGLPAGFWDYDKADAPLPELEQRIAQLGAIASTRGPAATAATTYVLRADPDPQARKAAIGVLAGLRPSDDARKALTQAVADVDAEVRAAALRALSRGGGEKPVALLAQALKGDTDIGVRMAAIESLSGKDGELARAVLQGALGDADPQVREAAKQALARR